MGNDAANELHGGIAGSKLHVYVGLGHGAYEEAKDLFIRPGAGFLQSALMLKKLLLSPVADKSNGFQLSERQTGIDGGYYARQNHSILQYDYEMLRL